jgi:DNA-binding NarL/FixJ family response regulator
MTLLIVEDNAGVRSLLRRALQGMASQIWECSDGEDALKSYAEHRPDIVLMDIRMPRMDGLVATRLIRQSYPAARIVMVSDYDDEDLRHAASAAGASGYTLKQDLSELIDLLRSLQAQADLQL